MPCEDGLQGPLQLPACAPGCFHLPAFQGESCQVLSHEAGASSLPVPMTSPSGWVLQQLFLCAVCPVLLGVP